MQNSDCSRYNTYECLHEFYNTLEWICFVFKKIFLMFRFVLHLIQEWLCPPGIQLLLLFWLSSVETLNSKSSIIAKIPFFSLTKNFLDFRFIFSDISQHLEQRSQLHSKLGTNLCHWLQINVKMQVQAR